jgi:tetratricopeptide (TPR) repeat protein/tRNA A-37 threonylcarbamoyl transferase component Bud32
MIDAMPDGDAEKTAQDVTAIVCDSFDQIAEEFLARCRRGESPSVTEYEEKYPDHAERIRDLLPSVAMMEQLKRRLRPNRESTASAAAPMPQRLGDYRLIRELGRGGMGIVYEAVQESLSRHVALKVIPHHSLLDAKRRQRFQREAQAVAQLHHTNIVPIFAVGEHDGLPYYAMQYIRGSGLDAQLEGWRADGSHRGRDHWRFVARVGVQAAEALQYAHDQGILHRDIKPANLLVDEHDVVWITDFGLAKLLGREDLTNSGDVIGTLRYLAPEALRGQTDRRSDVYSLGLTLYELLTLQQPFGDLSPSELLRCVTEEQPTRPRKLDGTIPLDLETIVLKATAREPEHRYAAADEMADDLRSYLDDRPIRARRANPFERLGRWCRRNRAIAALGAVAALSLLLAAAAGWIGYASTRRALARADDNVKLSLETIEDLFNTLAPRSELEFNMDRFGPPRKNMGRGPAPGAPREFVAELQQDEASLLQGVLSFYDKFAARNETNSRLEGEAARAHRNVSALYRKLGRDQEANDAHARAAKRYEDLVARYPDESRYRFELARTYALDDQPGCESIPPDQIERGLKRALDLVGRLASESPGAADYVAALARWKARRGRALAELGRLEEAVESYRESIDHDEWLAGRWGDADIIHMVLATNRGSAAGILLELGRPSDARAVLDEANAELRPIVTAELERTATSSGPRRPGPGHHLAQTLATLAEWYRALGDIDRAGQLQGLAESIRSQSRGQPPDPPGGRRRGRGDPGDALQSPPGPPPRHVPQPEA